MNPNFYLLFAALAGVCLALQATANSRLRQVTLEPLWATYFSIIGTIVFSSLAMLILRPSFPTRESIQSSEWWTWIGGPLGALIVMSGTLLVPHLGAAKFIAFVVAGQLLASLILDHFGLMGLNIEPLTLGKAGGAILVVIGVVCMKFLQITFMNPIDALFAIKQKAFMPFLPAGDPNLAFTEQALKTLAANGASMIEVGVPFSDPIADGPVIQASYTRALQNGFKLDSLFESVRRISSANWNTPLVAMGSYSLMFKRGLASFIDSAMQAGFSGAVVPDLPVEEADDLVAAAKARDFKIILLVTPTTSPARAEKIVRACSGFVYVVSVVGITGARDAVPADLAGMVARLRTMTDLPLCVGFGVSTPAHVKAISTIADGVIVGSALVKLLDQPDALHKLSTLSQSLSGALS